MSNYGIQGQLLEITVVGCNKLKDTEWISRQDPYVCIEYGSTKFRTRTCTDGGKNPTFQEKFVFSLIEGLREVNVFVWNSNTISTNDFIGSGKVQLQKVLYQGFDDTLWPLQTKTGRHAGEVRLIMHYANVNAIANKPPKNYGPPASAYSMPTPMMYSGPPPSLAPYPGPPTFPPSRYPAHPSYPAPYPPSPYNEPPIGAYLPPYGGASSVYPPPPYPPVGHQPVGYPPGPYPGMYPPRPY